MYLFRPVKNNRTGTLERHFDPGSVYRVVSAFVAAVARSECTQRPLTSALMTVSRPYFRTMLTRQTSPKSRSGWGMPTLAPLDFTTRAKASPRTARHFT
jgi:hypothetical protein